MVGIIEETYTISEAFRAWLRQHRPRAMKVLKSQQITSGVLETQAGTTRCRLRFAGHTTEGPARKHWLPLRSSGREIRDIKYGESGFDRQVDTDELCLIFDDHPDQLRADT